MTNASVQCSQNHVTYFSRKVAWTKSPLTCSASFCSGATPSSWLCCAADYHLSRTPSQPLYWCQAHRYFLVALPASRIPPCWLSTSPESSCQLPREDLAMVWLCLENWKGKIREKAKWKLNVEMFTLFDVKMIQIWTFPAAPSTERVLSLAERVAYLRLTSNYSTSEYQDYYIHYIYSYFWHVSLASFGILWKLLG